AALAAHAVLECDPGEVAAAVIRPGVVDALEVLDVAFVLEREERAAMRATVLEGVDAAVGIAHHNDRHRSHEGGAVVAGIRDLRLEAEVVPRRAFVDALLLQAPDLFVLVHPVRHASEAGRPRAHQFGWMFAAFATACHCSSPDVIMSANFFGVLASWSTCSAAMRSRNCGVATMRAISACSLPTIGAGVPAGARMPIQLDIWRFG